MKHSLFKLNFCSLRKPLLIAASIALLVSCAEPPQASLLSRLPASHPDAVPTSAKKLSKAERKRYAEIDEQVLAEQNKVIASEEAAAQAYYAYYAYSSVPIFYGNYYHSWPRWRMGVPYGSSIGWSWGW